MKLYKYETSTLQEWMRGLFEIESQSIFSFPIGPYIKEQLIFARYCKNFVSSKWYFQDNYYNLYNCKPFESITWQRHLGRGGNAKRGKNQSVILRSRRLAANAL